MPDVLVAVSDAGIDFRVVRRVDNSLVKQLSRASIRVDQLKTRGRFVLVRLTPPYGAFVFVDEIRVLQGSHDPDDAEIPEETVDRLRVDLHTDHQKRLLRALDRLRVRVTQSDLAGEFAQRVEALRTTADRAPSERTGKVRFMDPQLVTDLNRQLRDLQLDVLGRTASAQSGRLAVWDVSPWADLHPGDVPPPEDEGLENLEIVAGTREYESQAFMVTNLGDRELTLDVGLQGPWQQGERWGGFVKLRHAVFMEFAEGALLADALPLLDHPLTIPPWESRLIWLEVYTGDARPGLHHGALTLSYTSGTEDSIGQQRVELIVDILSVGMPDEIPVATFSWQYLDSGRTPSLEGIEDAAVADLASHYNNFTILSNNSWTRPGRERGEVDNEGNLLRDPDFEEFDRWVTLCRPISQKGMTWFPSLPFHDGLETDTPRHRTYSQWTKKWVAHLAELGLEYDDFLVYPTDENVRGAFVNSGEAIDALDPGVRVFATTMMHDDDSVLLAAARYLDVCCVSLDVRRPRQITLLKESGTSVWSYVVGRRRSSPYAGYRLALWKAFDMGATGCGFWCYSENLSKSRNLWEHSGLDYNVIYTREGAPDGVSRAEEIIPSRRWEAWREGIEDYTYLDTLAQMIKRRGPSSESDRARRTLEAALERVLSAPEDDTQAELHRRKVLQAIVDLSASDA